MKGQSEHPPPNTIGAGSWMGKHIENGDLVGVGKDTDIFHKQTSDLSFR